MLQSAQPYPGDVNPQDPEGQFEEKRFFLYLISDTEYLIMDHERDTELTISAELLHKPDFMPALWYAQMCASELGLNPDDALEKECYLEEMGDVEAGAVKIMLEHQYFDDFKDDLNTAPLDIYEARPMPLDAKASSS
ncbi:hypothetical protein B0H17DRAFT_1136562 [Mycena rosella]|uniref:Uncharacterized protein n=1 Tax=Mycena rosella TaxID=1033263 RepID=A0AAD7GDR0_MYCRO|nr:hypothetical protein B0H17DRAFT_1138939 [Mycena rosella]KAJ7687058.1 hypothetical protein B0H17DRAFT_1136562 [Mycena rosella]